MSASELRKAVECPICYDVCSRVYICLNGHSICAGCKTRVAICPLGACRYSATPTRNRAVEAIVEVLRCSAPKDWVACAVNGNCQFKVTHEVSRSLALK